MFVEVQKKSRDLQEELALLGMKWHRFQHYIIIFNICFGNLFYVDSNLNAYDYYIYILYFYDIRFYYIRILFILDILLLLLVNETIITC